MRTSRVARLCPLLLLPTKGKVVVPGVSEKEKVVVTVTCVDKKGRTGPTATAKRGR
ncbi:MAG: hypothetical protein WB767_17180 [Nocardioides sp.]